MLLQNVSKKKMTQTVPPALSQGYGYGIILGVGFAFAIFMV